ncbi:MAG: rpsP [Patescibacteria group bacterium]|nr:rpsP [Patescibacteria group bacterium]
MLVIRLARHGRAKYPTYRIVAAESARAATGKFVAVLGHYNPHTKELVMKHEEVKKHLGNGAQPSNTVVKLLMRDKVELPAWVKLKTKAPKAVEAPAAEEVAAEAAAESK